ncbi:MAG: hypothetical protein N2201_06655 [candidate division WOR-3 bacterium]|nr:hypothetical protein [candidate division WOR-3 bacterium]
MLSTIIVISLFISSDTIEIKSTQGISYRLFVSDVRYALSEPDADFSLIKERQFQSPDSTLYFQFKTNKNWSASQRIDEKVSEYAMTVTDGDYIHLVWVKQGRIYYKMNMYSVTKDSLKKIGTPRWECNIAISIPGLNEPASNISIGVDGEYLSVTWETPLAGHPTLVEKWRRRRWLWEIPFYWNTPECLSELINRNLIRTKE